MALTTAEATRLASLQTAYDMAISGKGVARVEFNGRVTAFSAANAELLRGEIDALNAKAASRSGRTRGAVRFHFR